MKPRYEGEPNEIDHLRHTDETPLTHSLDPDDARDMEWEDRRFNGRTYENGSIISDCIGINELAKQILSLMPPGTDIFEVARKRNEQEAANELALRQMYAGLRKAYD